MAKGRRKRRGPGRPPLPKGERTVRFSVALRRADAIALRRLARSRGVSVSSIVQDLVREALRTGGGGTA